MYRILSIKIWYDDKVEPPLIVSLLSVVYMCTVRSQCSFSPSHTNPREVVQLDATIRATCGKHTSISLSKSVGKVPLRAFGEDKVEVRQCCLILCECTVLNFQGHRLCEFAGC